MLDRAHGLLLRSFAVCWLASASHLRCLVFPTSFNELRLISARALISVSLCNLKQPCKMLDTVIFPVALSASGPEIPRLSVVSRNE